MAPAHAWLWQNEDESDVSLIIYPAGDGPDGAWTSGKPEPLARLSLHVFVLASVSPEYYRRHLTRLRKEQEQGASTAMQGGPAEPQAKRARVADRTLELTCFPGEPEAVPEAVMHHAYTGKLPNDSLLLIWMVRRADYLDMRATVEACLAQLRTMADDNTLTLQDLIVLHSLPALQTLNGPATQQHIDHVTDRVLTSQLGVAHKVLAHEQLLGQLVQLPFQLFKRWAALESVEIDSENTMAVLITAWYDHQLSSAPPATAPTEQQCKELSALIRLSGLSTSFHMQVMPHLLWYHGPPRIPQHSAVVRVLTALRPELQDSRCRGALTSGGVARQLHPTKTFTVELSQQDIQTLWTHGDWPLGVPYFAGYEFRLGLSLSPTPSNPPRPAVEQQPAPAGQQAAAGAQQPAAAGAAAGAQQPAAAAAAAERRRLGVSARLFWPPALDKHGVGGKSPTPAAGVRVQVQVAKAAGSKAFICFGDRSLTYSNFFQQSFKSFEEFASFAARSPPSSQPGQLTVRVTLSEIS